MQEYMPCDWSDGSGVLVEFYNGMDQIPGIDLDTGVVPVHQHESYELMLVLRGGCEHFFQHAYVPMLPGDCFLVPPHHRHAYRISRAQISLCCCRFDGSILHDIPQELEQDADFFTPSLDMGEEIGRLRALHMQSGGEEAGGQNSGRGAGVRRSRVLHLDHAELETIAALLHSIENEQQTRRFGFAYMKRLLMAQGLTLLRRIQLRQFGQISEQRLSWKEQMVREVTAYIEADLTREIDFKQIAQQQGITMTYFREIFKEITGLTPVDYINRSRVLFALELLQTTDLSVAEIAMRSGILDANYFSRLFKKIVGYPPSYFKSICTLPDGEKR